MNTNIRMLLKYEKVNILKTADIQLLSHKIYMELYKSNQFPVASAQLNDYLMYKR